MPLIGWNHWFYRKSRPSKCNFSKAQGITWLLHRFMTHSVLMRVTTLWQPRSDSNEDGGKKWNMRRNIKKKKLKEVHPVPRARCTPTRFGSYRLIRLWQCLPAGSSRPSLQQKVVEPGRETIAEGNKLNKKNQGRANLKEQEMPEHLLPNNSSSAERGEILSSGTFNDSSTSTSSPSTGTDGLAESKCHATSRSSRLHVCRHPSSPLIKPQQKPKLHRSLALCNNNPIECVWRANEAFIKVF